MHVAHCVRLRVFIGSVLASSLLSAQALHAEDAPANESAQPRVAPNTLQHFDAERPPPIENTEADPELDYSDALTLSYALAAPLLGVGVTLGLSRFNSGNITIWHVLGGVLAAGLAPAAVHWWNAQTARGIRALFVFPALVSAATVVVTLLTYGVLTIARTPPRSDEDGYLGREVISLAAGFAGCIVALVAWAVFDLQNSAAPLHPRSRATSVSALRFTIAPTEHGVAGLLSGGF
jgi:hypothetical protein